MSKFFQENMLDSFSGYVFTAAFLALAATSTCDAQPNNISYGVHSLSHLEEVGVIIDTQGEGLYPVEGISRESMRDRVEKILNSAQIKTVPSSTETQGSLHVHIFVQQGANSLEGVHSYSVRLALTQGVKFFHGNAPGVAATYRTPIVSAITDGPGPTELRELVSDRMEVFISDWREARQY